MDYEIKKAKLHNLHRIVELYNEVAKDLDQRGINQWPYPYTLKEMCYGIKNEEFYILKSNKENAGAFIVSSIPDEFPVEHKEGSFYASKILLNPKYQGENLGDRIIDFVRNNYENVYLDCWSGNKKLKEFYKRNNCEHLGDFKENDYKISIFKV